MGLRLAVKRSYRYFIPSDVLHPRKLIRELYVPVFAGVLGYQNGWYSGARGGDPERLQYGVLAAYLVLLALGSWAGVRPDVRSDSA